MLQQMSYPVEAFRAALENHKEYAAALEANGGERQVYGISLPYSEWYLVSVMPYSMLDHVINNLDSQRMFMTLLSCVSVLIILTLIFFRYFSSYIQFLYYIFSFNETFRRLLFLCKPI